MPHNSDRYVPTSNDANGRNSYQNLAHSFKSFCRFFEYAWKPLRIYTSASNASFLLASLKQGDHSQDESSQRLRVAFTVTGIIKSDKEVITQYINYLYFSIDHIFLFYGLSFLLHSFNHTQLLFLELVFQCLCFSVIYASAFPQKNLFGFVARYWDTRQSNPVHTQQLPDRCYALSVLHPLMVVGTADRNLVVFNLQNPQVLSICLVVLIFIVLSSNNSRIGLSSLALFFLIKMFVFLC